jgi:hypothetical protein
MLLWQPLNAMMYVGKVGTLELPRTSCLSFWLCKFFNGLVAFYSNIESPTEVMKH